MNGPTATMISVIALVVAVGSLVASLASRSTPAPGDRARLARLERQQRAIMEQLGIASVDASVEPDMPDVVDFLMRGQKIQAIKVYREATDVGLKEAKDAVEEIARRNGL